MDLNLSPKIIKLIQAVEKRRILYDSSYLEYKMSLMRQNAWKEVARELRSTDREENEADDPVPAPENVELDTLNENVAPNYSIEGKKPNKKRKIERLSDDDKAILKLLEGPKETVSYYYGRIIALTMEEMNLSAMDQAKLFNQLMGVIDNFKRSDQ